MKKSSNSSLNNKRLEDMVRMAYDSRIGVGIYVIDAYMGRTIRTEYLHTFTTRTATDNNTFVLEVHEEDSDKRR